MRAVESPTGEALAPAGEIDRELLRSWPLPPPSADADKESRGRVLVVAGSREMAGAAMLAGVAALRAGAGKLVIATSRARAPWLSVAVPEARVIGLAETRSGAFALRGVDALAAEARGADALLLGPGMIDEAGSVAFVGALLGAAPDVPAVLDALGINALPMLGERGRVLITPHAGEMAHLTGAAKEAIVDDPRAAAQGAAARWHAVVTLKGAVTWIVMPGGEAWRHAAGHPGLATSGSGDVLAGLAAGFVARGAGLTQAACWGAAVHAAAGRRASARVGRLGFLARELGAEVPGVLQELS